MGNQDLSRPSPVPLSIDSGTGEVQLLMIANGAIAGRATYNMIEVSQQWRLSRVTIIE